MHLKMDKLHDAINTLSPALKDHGLVAEVVGQNIARLRDQYNQIAGQTVSYNANLLTLTNTFGLTKAQVLEMAQYAGVNLTAALKTEDIQAFTGAIGQIGGVSDDTKAKLAALGQQGGPAIVAVAAGMQAHVGDVSAAAGNASSAASTAFTSPNWNAAGQTMMQHLAEGIMANDNAAISAVQNTVNQINASFASISGAPTGPIVGHRAGGGPVSSGTPYVVGENGPELFVPGGSGSIVPQTSGGTPVASAGGGPATVILEVDGNTIGQILFPYLQTAGLQNKRNNVDLGLS